MKLLDDLASTAIAPALLAQVRALFEQQQAELEQRQTQLGQQQAALAERDASLNRQATVLAEKDFKITALTHELAYYRRNRFSKASEALAGEQSRLFEDTVDADLAASKKNLSAKRLPGSAQACWTPGATARTAAH